MEARRSPIWTPEVQPGQAYGIGSKRPLFSCKTTVQFLFPVAQILLHCSKRDDSLASLVSAFAVISLAIWLELLPQKGPVGPQLGCVHVFLLSGT